jgi:preprotein translocase subunit SecG
MQAIIFVIHVFAALGLIGLILIQHGKGADMGAAFGGGASNTVFGSVGSMPFLTKITALLAAIFFATCLGLGYITSKEVKQSSGVAPSAPTQSLPHAPQTPDDDD